MKICQFFNNLLKEVYKNFNTLLLSGGECKFQSFVSSFTEIPKVCIQFGHISSEFSLPQEVKLWLIANLYFMRINCSLKNKLKQMTNT